MACDRCEHSWDVYFETEPVRGPNVERHSYLYACPTCGSLYEVVPEGRRPPEPVTRARADELFPE